MELVKEELSAAPDKNLAPGLTIFTHPHPLLRLKAVALNAESEEEREHVRTVSAQMISACRSLKALGLAANQIGASRAYFVMRMDDGSFEVVINPKITDRKQTQLFVEGCLSFPGQRSRTVRAKEITATWLSVATFEEKTAVLSGLEAVVFQHEFDHLQGKTMKDRTTMKRAHNG